MTDLEKFFQTAKQRIASTSTGTRAVIVAIVVTAVYSIRWSNCLPFSGYFPALDNVDRLSFVGRFLVFAREPFSFPLGTIHNLSFPFESAHIARGVVSIAALLFKAIGQIYRPMLEFDYFVLTEILAVFVTALITCRLLNLFAVRSLSIQILGACFVALSPALLYRSSSYYGETFVVLNFPLILLTAYFFLRLFVYPERWKYRISVATMFPVIALVDLYLLFGAFILLGTSVVILTGYYSIVRRADIPGRIFSISLSVLAGGALSIASLWAIGNQDNLEPPPRIAVFENRYGTDPGYGGGYGGGYHVADVFSIFIADPSTSSEANVGPPNSVFSRMNVPLLSRRMQSGQFEGFSFVGSVPTLILFAGLGVWISGLRRTTKPQWAIDIWRRSIFKWMEEPLHLAVVSFSLGCFCLYVLSWGYVLHVFGDRLNGLLTPSTILAFLYPKFMYARALGRLAIPFSMLASMLAVFIFYRLTSSRRYPVHKASRLVPALTAILVLVHLFDVSDYLRAPLNVVKGNEVAKVFSDEDITTLQSAAGSSAAVMLVPELMTDLLWNKIGYSIAYHVGRPISGSTLGFGEKSSQVKRYKDDVSSLLNGKIQALLSLYGPVVIAAPRSYAMNIQKNADVPLTLLELKSQDLVLLIPKGS